MNKLNYYSNNSFNINNFFYIYNRITGISPLFATVAYEHPDTNNNISFYSNLFTRGSYQPETYFGCNILKDGGACPPPSTAYAPTGWSTFYIYNGVAGVIIGFLVLGSIFAILEKCFINLKYKEIFLPLYTVPYAISFPAMIFEGTIVFYFKRHVLSFLLAFFTFIAIIYLISKFRTSFSKSKIN